MVGSPNVSAAFGRPGGGHWSAVMTDADAEVASFLAKAGLTEHLEVAWFLAKAGLTFDEADMRECGLDPGQAALVRRTLQELAPVAAEARQEKPETLSGRGKGKGKGKRQSGHGKSKDKGKHSTCNEVLVQVLALVLVH